MFRRTISKLIRVAGILPLVKSLYWALLKVASSNGMLSDLWYLFSGEFRREHLAVLSGRSRHNKGLSESKDSGAVYTLRRNTHRLEKGLIMQPRRSVFALDYIEETARLYHELTKKAINSSLCDIQTLGWAHDVMTSYFDCVDHSNPTIERANEYFVHAGNVEFPDKFKLKPYVRELDQPVGFSIDDFHRLAIRRRSCRWFRQKRVPRSLIDKAIEVGTLAPSACNRQPFEFRIFDDPELAKEIGKIPFGTANFSHNFPCVIVLIGDMSAFVYERDRHIPYIDASLAAMGFQFALELQGLSSCCINWPDVEYKELAITKALRLHNSQRVVMLIAVGYPDKTAMVPYSNKKPLDEIRSYQTDVG